MEPKALAKFIDHTLLKPDAAESEIKKLCAEAKEFGFFSVCIEKKWLDLACNELKGSTTIPITVISFPKGNGSSESKAQETLDAIALGAMEVDMVLNRELLAQKDYAAVLRDIQGVVKAAREIPVKVILETSELNEDQKVIACSLASAAGAKFVKTSTGFSRAGATVSDIQLMRRTVGAALGVKASGGVRTYADAVKMIEAGASRLGTSASVAIVSGSTAGAGGY